MRRKQKERTDAMRNLLLSYGGMEMIEQAKDMYRRVYIHVGLTNSGKTYAALQALKRADKGAYLGPLRLLALEVFDTLNEQGVPCSLLTGEEKIDIPFSNKGRLPSRCVIITSITMWWSLTKLTWWRTESGAATGPEQICPSTPMKCISVPRRRDCPSSKA